MVKMSIIDKYISYIRDIRRYSERTVDIYGGILRNYVETIPGNAGEKRNEGGGRSAGRIPDSDIISSMNRSEIRKYEVALLERGISARTVGLHLSALSGFCNYLIKNGLLKSNPVKLVAKPRPEKRLPEFYKSEAMDAYFKGTSYLLDPEEQEFFIANHNTESGKAMYTDLLGRLIISMLYGLGIRRAELINMNIGDVDFGRNIVQVRGKGDKMRKIPIIASLSEEIVLYLKAVEAMCGGKRSLKEPLLITYTGRRLYPGYVDRTVKRELGDVKGITGRKSPHVLRHSLATELMNGGTDINSIKELLGHSSLATTQVYTHSSISRLKNIYESAHPRAKNGGKNGD